jgi:pyrroline-5-carboxylate reductase
MESGPPLSKPAVADLAFKRPISDRPEIAGLRNDGMTAMTPETPADKQIADLRHWRGTLVLVGAGKMGGALLDGWLQSGLDPASITVLEPAPSSHVIALAERGVRLNPAAAPRGVDAIVIAVKPQMAEQAMPAINSMLGASTLVVSIMAGRTLRFLSQKLTGAGALVRAMPNTPAAIGRGITVAVAQGANAAQRGLAHGLLSATGTVEWVEDETLMDAVTAVSGSGPAYVFLLAEALAQAGFAAGLPQALADKLARQTVAGAGEMLHRSSRDAAALRENVTSPGGTTAAALNVLMGDNGLAVLMRKAVAAATERSRQLAG